MNVVLIVSDTFRYDHLGCNGNNWIKTPELDAFAKKAVIFDECHVSSFPTIPHRTDMLTGRYSFPFHGWAPLAKGIPTLQGCLTQAGYVNQLIADTPHLMKHEYNFSQNFHGYYWSRGQEGDIAFTRCNYEVPTMMRPEKTRMHPIVFGHPLVDLSHWINREWTWEEDTFPAQTARLASKWLEENYKTEKFFLYVDFFDPHEPWNPPQYFVDMYDPHYKGLPMLHPNYGPATAYTKRELTNLRAHYAGELTLVGKWVGYILRKVEDLGLFGNTAVIFTTDHGMYIGEHNRAGKSNICAYDDRGPWPLYQEITHIPLMMRVPGVKPARIGQLVQPPDIMPTVLDLAHAKKPDSLHGKSLVPLMKGRPAKPLRQYAFCSQALSANVKTRPKTTVRDKNWTLILGGKEGSPSELYNVRKDPAQKKNVLRNNKNVAVRLHSALMKFLREVGTEEEKMASIAKL